MGRLKKAPEYAGGPERRYGDEEKNIVSIVSSGFGNFSNSNSYNVPILYINGGDGAGTCI